MIAPWAYCRNLASVAPSVCDVSEEEARHLSASRRLRAGDAITLFDGTGLVADARVGTPRADGGLEVEVSAVRLVSRVKPAIDIASALPKGDRLATLLEAAGALAARRFIPLLCERSVVAWNPSINARGARVLVAACKQARQPHLPEVAPAATVTDAVARSVEHQSAILMAHPGGARLTEVVGRLAQDRSAAAITVLIGPEGGFTDSEVAMATDHGAMLVSLGDSVLRIELAVAATLAAFRV